MHCAPPAPATASDTHENAAAWPDTSSIALASPYRDHPPAPAASTRAYSAPPGSRECLPILPSAGKHNPSSSFRAYPELFSARPRHLQLLWALAEADPVAYL